MPIRITGMNSGLDTEKIISELVKVQSSKKDKLIKSQKSLSYKQDAWKELNTKIYNLYSKTVSNMKFSTTYAKKASTVSNTSVASVSASSTAVDGTQSLEVSQLAKTGYLTGAKLDSSVGSATKMSDLDPTFTGGTFSVTVNGSAKEVSLDASSTVATAVSKLREAGVNASFDSGNKRFFISSKESGQAADFTMTPADANGTKAMELLGIANGMTGVTKIAGQNAMIKLNGAEFESATNAFSVNGLTITALSETEAGSPVSINTSNDTAAIYDIIKGFVSEYNTLIKEVDTKYNAESAKGFQPLTSEEKAELSDKEVEEWENKIKTSILRRDNTLSEVGSVLKSATQKGITVGGETLYLSTFGIGTMGYFDAPDNEKGLLHIDGDETDTTSSGKDDKLKAAIAQDPEKMVEFFTNFATNMYDQIFSKMTSTSMRSIYKVYNDKQMKSDYDSYTVKIAKQEERLRDLENKYYKQFSAMETALSKLTSKETAISGLLGN